MRTGIYLCQDRGGVCCIRKWGRHGTSKHTNVIKAQADSRNPWALLHSQEARLRLNTPEVSHGNKSPQGHVLHTIANEGIIAAGTLWNDPLFCTQLAPLIRNNNKIFKDQRRDEDSLKKESEKDTFLCCHFSTLNF